MSGRFGDDSVHSGVEKSQGQDADQSTLTWEYSTPRHNHQYRPNNDPRYLYGNPPSTVDPYVSSMADWTDPPDTNQHFQYGNPETMTSGNPPNVGPYYLSNPSPYVRTDRKSSYVAPGQQSYVTSAGIAPFQHCADSDLSASANNLGSNILGGRARGVPATRSSFVSKSEYGAYSENNQSMTRTKSVNDNFDDEDDEVTIHRARKTGGSNLKQSRSQSTSGTVSEAASLAACKSSPITAPTTISEQGIRGLAQRIPSEYTSVNETSRHGQGRGRVRWENGVMVWREIKFDDTEKPWQPAMYHYGIRAELIASAKARGTYDFPREQGLAKHDVTCFLQSQKTWDVNDRTHRPAILYQWKKAGHVNPTYIVPDWYHKGMIVLDAQNHPVRKFRNIPDTCSSMLEGGIMEAVKREDGRINHQDFVARMLPQILVEGSGGPKSQPLYGKNAMAARMRRFRERACCIVWGGRAGSDTIRGYLETILPAQCITDNSTRNFRDLHEHEILGIRKQNAGRFSERAGHRAIDDVNRKLREEKMDARIDRRRKQFDKKQESSEKTNGRKRKRAAQGDAEDEDDEAGTSDMTAAGGNTAPRRKQRKLKQYSTIGASRTGGSSRLGDDGDDEERQSYDPGCAIPNPNSKRQAKRTESTDETELVSAHTYQSWAPMTPFAEGNMANVAGVQQADPQEFYDAGVNDGSFIALGGFGLGTSAVNAVSDQIENDLLNGVAFAEEMTNFYSSLATPACNAVSDRSAGGLLDSGAFAEDLPYFCANLSPSNAISLDGEPDNFEQCIAACPTFEQSNANTSGIELDDTLRILLEQSLESNVEQNCEVNEHAGDHLASIPADLLNASDAVFEEFLLPYEDGANTPRS